ncbi:uncharacterized protein LOC120008097 [Tripterygium wilfordii]|uniref:uncharacterized protein LOC120008097 n=1 Tax=Tripterygium wilfordii TaxID=458696 RepID=UPI0018F847B9|nr:uncharacterized protein LOC120008097 [Tripterygium wilfordii]
MGSSTKCATIISSIAFSVYFSLIIFQVPLFRVPCGTGICQSPIQVTSYQLIAYEVIPAFVAKTLLYPGAIANAIIKNKPIPNYNKLLNLYNFTHMKKAATMSDLEHLEVLAGSYLLVAGAFLGLVSLRPGRMSLFGTFLIIWGIVREVSFRKHTKAFSIYPTMFIVVFCSFLAIRRVVRKIVRWCKAPWSKAKFM